MTLKVIRLPITSKMIVPTSAEKTLELAAPVRGFYSK
jgi:hypothetical protein